MTERQELRFNKLCYKFGIYDSNFEEHEQCGGYKTLKKFIDFGQTAATEEEYKRWITTPTDEELNSSPELKYLFFLHPDLARMLRRKWKELVEFINS